jgi:ferric-dicitrate binding protein FerR (iron transport regulator)
MKNRATLTLAAVALFALAGAAQAAQIGVAAAVTNDVQGFEGGAPRQLTAGSGVFANERVRTGAASAAQLLFVDKTTVSIGPQAEITLDKFIYDPNKGTGQVVLDTVRGSFRFITGSQNPNRYAIKTPVGTLGIRGTIVNLLIQNDYTIVGLSEGIAKLTLANGQVIELNQIGMAYKIDKQGNVTGPYPFNVADNKFGELGWTFAGDPVNLNIGGIDQLNAINALNQPPCCYNRD